MHSFRIRVWSAADHEMTRATMVEKLTTSLKRAGIGSVFDGEDTRTPAIVAVDGILCPHCAERNGMQLAVTLEAYPSFVFDGSVIVGREPEDIDQNGTDVRLCCRMCEQELGLPAGVRFRWSGALE
jgi:hypothetical protein